MTTEHAREFAISLCRSDEPKFRSIGQKLLALKTDEDLVNAVRLIEAIAPTLPRR